MRCPVCHSIEVEPTHSERSLRTPGLENKRVPPMVPLRACLKPGRLRKRRAVTRLARLLRGERSPSRFSAGVGTRPMASTSFDLAAAYAPRHSRLLRRAEPYLYVLPAALFVVLF